MKHQLLSMVEKQIARDLESATISNQMREVYIKFSDMAESKNSFTLNRYLVMMRETIGLMKDLPLCPEKKPGRFSSEDKPNVSIPSAMEPILYEIWPGIAGLIEAACARVLFTEKFGDLMLEYERAMSTRRRKYLDGQLAKIREEGYELLDPKLW